MCNRCNKNITYQERLKIEVLHQQGYSARRIAEALGRGERTIYRELKRGPYLGIGLLLIVLISPSVRLIGVPPAKARL